MNIFLNIVQIILSLAIVGLIFLQSNGDTDGRSNLLSTSGFEKRGWEKIMFYLTLVVLFLFIISSFIQTLV